MDMVVDPFLPVPLAINNTGFGIGVQEQVVVTDPTNSVVSHKFANQFKTKEDVQKLQMPRITLDQKETARRAAVTHELFDEVIELRTIGYDMYFSLWDPIAMWMGVENALYAMVDQPDVIHMLLARMVQGYMSQLDQLEQQGLLCQPQGWIHCTGAYTDELPAPGYDPRRPRAKDIWVFGLAQMLATVSPEMFQEFEVDYVKPICDRFGLVYYGCCDPLDLKMKEVRMIPKVRKVSMSPWVDQERGAAELGRDYVFSRKPNPALLAPDAFDPDQVRSDLKATSDICKRHGCDLEFILKDISTIRYERQRLFEWARIAMEVAQG